MWKQLKIIAIKGDIKSRFHMYIKNFMFNLINMKMQHLPELKTTC